MKAYVIEMVIMNKLNENHIPYMIGSIVSGPKGGKYFLDTFNTELLFKKMLNINVLDPSLIINNARDNDILRYVTLQDTNESNLATNIVKQINCKLIPLIRLKGKATTLKIAEKM
jgi:hypothetical protein